MCSGLSRQREKQSAVRSQAFPSVGYKIKKKKKKSVSANSAGEANSQSLPLLICPSRALVSLNADTVQLQSHRPLSPWTSPSGESYGLSLRSPPVRKEASEHAPSPGAPFLSAHTFLPSTQLSLSPARLGTFLPAWRSPRLAGPQGTLLSRSAPAPELPGEGPSALTLHPWPVEQLVERKRAPRPCAPPRRRRSSPCSTSPHGEGGGGAPDAARRLAPAACRAALR